MFTEKELDYIEEGLLRLMKDYRSAFNLCVSAQLKDAIDKEISDIQKIVVKLADAEAFKED